MSKFFKVDSTYHPDVTTYLNNDAVYSVEYSSGSDGASFGSIGYGLDGNKNVNFTDHLNWEIVNYATISSGGGGGISSADTIVVNINVDYGNPINVHRITVKSSEIDFIRKGRTFLSAPAGWTDSWEVGGYISIHDDFTDYVNSHMYTIS